jgi:hypothetical protein
VLKLKGISVDVVWVLVFFVVVVSFLYLKGFVVVCFFEQNGRTVY